MVENRSRCTQPVFEPFPWKLTAYYLLRPVIPRRLQLALRRRRAKRIRQDYNTTWPVDPGALARPEGWPGWPEGKDFAVVLTHDVESTRGVDRVRQVMELEESLGFRSSFNFVGGDYPVPAPLIQEIVARGFEVGVHGLHHNGLMYSSRRVFEKHAAGINRLLKKWNAVGFRSPAMHRNLEWIHELDILYDLSTFDTDPFEPQPTGVGTIFPFWLVNQARTQAYVELPYTLPQDFTLFTILEEKDNQIWKEKLDWIAGQRGMALINTHPDYMGFEGSKLTSGEYPVEHYRDLLQYIKDSYVGAYWHSLPCRVADYFASTYPKGNELEASSDESVRRPLRICMPAYTFYVSDNRVRRYAETLAGRGDEVEVVCLGQPGKPRREVMQGVTIHRIQNRSYDERGPFHYLIRVVVFLLRSTVLLSWFHLRRKYDLIHVHNIPDFQVFSALVPRLSGSKVILDIHDVVPEVFCSKFHKTQANLLFRALCWVEKASARFSHHVIIANDLWRARLEDRSVDPERCSVFLNYPDPSIFKPVSPNVADGGRKIVVYPGTLNYHQGLDIAVEAFAAVNKKVPEAEFHIYGVGPTLEDLKAQVKKLGLESNVHFLDCVPIDEIPKVMAGATCGVVPKRAEGFGDEAFSTKTLEFMAMGVPVLVSSTTVDRHYFNDSVVLFFESGNVQDLADKMTRLLLDADLRKNFAIKGSEFAEQYSWEKKEAGYLRLVDRLTQDGAS